MIRDFVLLTIGFVVGMIIVGYFLLNEIERLDAYIAHQSDYIDRNIRE